MIDDGWLDRWLGGWGGCVCVRSSRFLPPLLSPSASIRSAVSSRALTARGDWSGPGN